MKRKAVLSTLAAAGLAFNALSASATVSLSIISPDHPNLYVRNVYEPGETVTLQVIAQADGGETANAILGSILYSNTLFTGPTTSQVALNASWTPGALSCTTARCQAFNQMTPPGPALPGNVAAGTVISTLTFTIAFDAFPQAFTFNWQTTPSTQRVDWFGIDPLTLPGYTIQIVGGIGPPMPEPTTGALLGLGLFGLAFARRDRVARRP
ncbi:MAG TPA: PEP-CTERM sorting domain-containing protein [Myxococcota bacterium]|nr:PEP-CTERM sorting domain-containing protein [Myxococcota bacterium]